jgi:hypothetical protein
VPWIWRKSLPIRRYPTMAATGTNGPLVPHTRPTLHANASNGWATTPRASVYNFGGFWGCLWPSNTLMLWWWCITTTSECLRAIHTLNTPQNYTPLLGGLSPIHLMHWRGAQGLMWGAMGTFVPVAAMVVAVVTPVVCCCSMAGAQTTLVQWNPGILGIAGKL